MIGKLSNQDVADRLFRIGQLYQLKNDRWRSRTFLNAAKIVEDLSEHVMEINLLELEGIGQAVEAVIHDLCATGTCRKLEALEAEFPDAALDLIWIPGIGPKRAQETAKRWGARTLEELLEALEIAGETGGDLYDRVMDGLRRKRQGRLSRWTVEPFAEAMMLSIAQCGHVQKATVAGSWRRGRLTVKDLDVLIAADEGWLDKAREEVMALAETLGTITSAGPTKIRWRYVCQKYSIDVDFLLVDIDCWGSALCYFTGSKSHNERLRSMAKAIGLKVNEYGVFRGEVRIGGAKETDLYEILGLEYVEPKDRRT